MSAFRVTVRIIGGAVVTCLVTACGVNTPPSGGTGPVSALRISGDSLHKLATNTALWPVRQSAKRNCEGGPRCDWLWPFNSKVEVDIYADTGARNVYANPAVSGATLIGRFENRGTATERRYNLTNGPYDFLLFVFPVPGSANGRWVVERVDRSKTGDTYQHEQVSQGLYKGCGHPETTYSKSFGQFLTCAKGPPPPPPGVTRVGAVMPLAVNTAGFAAVSFLKAMYMLMVANDPAWFTCQAGCCIADPPPT